MQRQTLADRHRAKLDEACGDMVFFKAVLQRRRRQALPRLIPDVAYEPVTTLTEDQKSQLTGIRCPIRNHIHALRLVYTARRVEDGQLMSWLACDQGATYRWELIHGVCSSRVNCPHWGWAQHHDQPPAGYERVRL